MNYRTIDPKSSARGRMLRAVLAVLKFRASLHGLGSQIEVNKAIEELRSEAESLRRFAVDKVSSERYVGNY